MPSKPRLQGGRLNQAVISVINALLDSADISRRELAVMLDTSHTYLNNRFNGNVDFTVTDVDVIANALRVDVLAIFAAAEWLRDGQPPKGLTRQEQIDVAALFEAAARYQQD